MLLYSITFVLLLHSQQILGEDIARPNSTAECEAMDYCHQGQCVMINKVVECNCIKPYVDDIDGTKCIYAGTSKLTIFLLNLFLGGLVQLLLMPVAAGISWLAGWTRIVDCRWCTDGSGH